MSMTLLLGTVLFLGDSHSVGPFGQALDHHLRSLHTPVYTRAYCGTISQDWYRESAVTKCGFLEIDRDGVWRKGIEGSVSKISPLLQDVRPQHVIVALATNYSGYKNDEFVGQDMRKMAKEIFASGANCLWVGMPTSRKLRSDQDRIERLTKEAVKGYCQYFDSFKVNSYPDQGGDGIHFYFPGGKEVAEHWALKVFESFKRRF